MKPSLLKHTGCDIIDVNPGAGVWSSAVHNLLQPRNHYLMEPDHELYRPLLQPLLDEEGSTYKLIPKSGVVWGHLNSILSSENLPQQQEYEDGDPRLDKPNDTLLFMANLGWHPRKPFRGFSSIAMLVVHQLLSASRAHSLFQRYGLIRMLIWVADEEGQAVLPRMVNLRRKMAIETELSCSNVTEIASSTQERLRSRREEFYNVQSSRAVLKRMNAGGITTPDGRAGLNQLKALKNPEAQDSEVGALTNREYFTELEELEKRLAAGGIQKFVGDLQKPQREKKPSSDKISPEYQRWQKLKNYEAKRIKMGKAMGRSTAAELEALEAKLASGELKEYADPPLNEQVVAPSPKSKPKNLEQTNDHRRLVYLRRRVAVAEKRDRDFAPLFLEFEAISKLQRKVKTLDEAAAEEMNREIGERTAAFYEGFEHLIHPDEETFRLQLDGRRTFNNDPSILLWDRREVEPLKVNPEEFYPKQELSLLDFHPQPIWPVLRKDFPANYDIFEYILSTLFIAPTQSVRHGLTALAPGAFDWLVKECPSITDITKDGNPNVDLMTVRCLTLEMFREIIEAWVRWPFRPHRYELMRKMGSVPFDADDEAPADR